MASKLKVEELRSELAKRGLSTAGIKPTLVRRLESAIREESKQSTDDKGDSERKKRERDSEGGGEREVEAQSNGLDKAGDVEQSGSKKKRTGSTEIESNNNGSNDNHPQVDEKGKDENENEKIITATTKGIAALDQWLSDEIKGDEIYDAMLNQTNVGHNNNKFYVIQALVSDDGTKYMVYNRWGRVGVKGQISMLGPYTTRENTIREFEQKFYGKTKNHWSNRKDFVSHPKSYTWLEMEYGENEETSVDL